MNRKWSARLLVVVMILAQTVLANAQEEPPLSPVEVYEVTFFDLGYDYSKKPTRSRAEYYSIYIPGNAVLAADQNYIDLFFSHTVADTRFPASLVVTLNDQWASTVALDAENAERSQARFALSADWFKPGRNLLAVGLSPEIPCGEKEDIPLVAAVHPESILHLEYGLSTRPPDLATYPIPFAERSLLPETVYLVLPSEPTAMDIATAATISAGLGQSSGGSTQVASVLDTALTEEIRSNHHLIAVGQMNRNHILSQLDLPVPLDPSAFPPEYGVIQEIVSPWNPYKMLLVVTGQSAEGVFKAGAALNREGHFLGMKGQVAIVEDILPVKEIEQTEHQADLTLNSLGYEDMVFYGSREQDVDYDFFMPLSWQMKENPKLTLAFQHAAMLDPDVSSLEVRLNNVPVGGVQLDNSNKTNGVVEIELPSWLLQPDRNRLNIQVKMDHPASGGDVCVYLDSEQIWTVIRRDSFIRLSYTLQSLSPSLDLFPYPFDTNANLSDLVIVLPDQLSNEERDGLLRLAAALGTGARGSQLTLRASTADELDETTKAASNLFILGQPTHNALMWELNDYLPQPFRPNSNMPAPGLDSVVLTPGTDREVGFIQELVSPWNTDRTILVITGMTSGGVSTAFEALLTQESALRGNLAVIEEGQIYAVDTRPLPSIEDETSLVKVVPLSLSRLTKIADNWW